MRIGYRLAALAATIALIVSACGGDDDDSASGSSKNEPQQSIGKGEGSVSILAWAYYAEDGSTDPSLDWVSKFEKDTGCNATVKVFGTSDEAVQLFATGQYDVVSASGDATLRLIASGDAAPLNTKLLDNYGDIAPFLKEQKNNSKDGVVYGVPHGWGANLLMFNKDVVSPAPDSWGVVFDKNSPYKGKITAYDSPIYIADAALYLMKTQPDLKIKDPYSLDADQFKAAVDLLKQQKSIVGEYWSDYLKLEEAYTQGSIVLGTTWQSIDNALVAQKPPVNVESVLPKEGSTAWSDNWMLYSKSKHPNCGYDWLNYITSPSVQATVASVYGEAPANLKACTQTDDPNHCKTYGADDESVYSKLYYWTTPTRECLDGRTDVECKDYAQWTQAWDEIKG
jgi:putative spermidine/putrescine transport system substrate-binding protein